MKRNLVEFIRASDTSDAAFSHLRGEAVLGKLLRRHPDDATVLQRAHELLQDDPNYAAAMHRVAKSLQDGYIRVFISYRVGIDSAAARTVAEIFQSLSGGRVVVTYADDFTARIAGQDYKSEIEEATKAAHWFVLLVSDSRELSSWCMYETGLFRAATTSRRLERLICLHHPEATLPGAIDGFQSVAGSAVHLQRFLDGLFRQVNPLPGWPALNSTVHDGVILEAANRIAEALRPPRKPVTFNPALTLVVRGPSMLISAEDLNGCNVDADQLAAQLFGKAEPPATWGDLVSLLQKRPEQSAWLDELAAVLRKAGSGNIFRPLVGTFESLNGARVMRPVLQSMEHDARGEEYRFHIFFLEEYLSSPTQDNLSDSAHALLTLVRMHNRVRWEVVERFSGVDWSSQELAACAKALSRVEREAQLAGGIDVQALQKNFDPLASCEMVDYLEDWAELCGAADGQLPSALREGDEKGVKEGMIQCRLLNRQLLERALPALERLTRRRHGSRDV